VCCCCRRRRGRRRLQPCWATKCPELLDLV
jgi:hypothetical protein